MKCADVAVGPRRRRCPGEDGPGRHASRIERLVDRRDRVRGAPRVRPGDRVSDGHGDGSGSKCPGAKVRRRLHDLNCAVVCERHAIEEPEQPDHEEAEISPALAEASLHRHVPYRDRMWSHQVLPISISRQDECSGGGRHLSPVRRRRLRRERCHPLARSCLNVLAWCDAWRIRSRSADYHRPGGRFCRPGYERTAPCTTTWRDSGDLLSPRDATDDDDLAVVPPLA